MTLPKYGLEAVVCTECKTIMDRVEDINGVEVSYTWNKEEKEYELVDRNFYGNTEVKYVCPECEEEIVIE